MLDSLPVLKYDVRKTALVEGHDDGTSYRLELYFCASVWPLVIACR